MTDLTERYGSPSSARHRVVVTAVVVIAAVTLSWLAWVVLENGRPEARSSLVSFHAAGEHAAVASFVVVRRSADVRASCLLRAYAADHAIVGELDVTVGPGGATTQTLERSVRTERRATSVEVVGCRAEGQNQRR